MAKDEVEAVKWFRKAANQGAALDQSILGCFYRDGRGVETNYVEAVKWYRKAAEQGDADAQFNLGCCYHDGRGVETNYVEAVKWYRKAAEQNLAKSNIIWAAATAMAKAWRRMKWKRSSGFARPLIKA